ncbi:MAG: ABC transporter ATP-binding protein [Terriglobia bacterium]
MPLEVLKGINLQMMQGEFLALMGASGCGKSTLLHLCGAMDLPSSGSVAIENVPLEQLDDRQLTTLRRTRVGFVFQFFNLLPTLTVVENVALPLLLTGARGNAASEAAKQWLVRMGLESRLNHYPQQLSGGEMQRAAIARALVHQPALLIADEPTGSLDSENGKKILDLLELLNAQDRITILLATHSSEIAARAKRILRMHDGGLIFE